MQKDSQSYLYIHFLQIILIQYEHIYDHKLRQPVPKGRRGCDWWSQQDSNLRPRA